MLPTLKIICPDDEIKMFYLPLTIEQQEKISIIVPENFSVGVGSIVTFDMGVKLECNTHKIILQPNELLQESPISIHNLSNPHSDTNTIKLFNNPIKDKYREFISSGIDAFKTDILKRVIGKSSKSKIIDKILDNVESHTLNKGLAVLDVYLHDYSTFNLELI